MVNLTFEEFGIDDNILRSIRGLGYIDPSVVQEKVIPLALDGKDIIVKSQTGSGKTAAFGIPLCNNVELEEKSPQALVLTPTRELAVQVKEDITNIGRYKRIRCAAIFGKQPIDMQKRELKQRVHIIVGTPGRTLDHLERGNINTEKIKYFILDEADEMLSMGFIDQVESIIRLLNKNRITMLFSATLPDKIEDLCNKYMINPVKVEINPEKLTVEKINQCYYEVEDSAKFESLNRILYIENPETCIIFCKTKENVEALFNNMNSLDYPCLYLHGGMDQSERLDVMKRFKTGEFRFLITTDVAARGIDIESVSHVINFDVPVEKERYVHRIGRTARAGKKGVSITLVTARENRLFQDIQDFINMEISRKEIPSKEEANQYKKAFIERNNRKPVLKEQKGSKLNREIMKLHINAGKDKKIRPGDIVGAITQINQIIAEDIGIIDIQDRYSYVEILNGKGKLVLESLNDMSIKGKAVKVKKAIK